MINTGITIYIADDHQIIIDGLILLLKQSNKYNIIGTSTNGEIAYNEILNKNPTIAILDIKMPNMNGLQLLLNLKNKVQTKFIILSMYDDQSQINNAYNYGADAYLINNIGNNDLIKCIDEVLGGKKLYPKILNNIKGNVLTPREIQILKLIINENTTSQIAFELNISEATVDTHRKNIWRKTNSKSIVGLVKYAIDNNLN